MFNIRLIQVLDLACKDVFFLFILIWVVYCSGPSNGRLLDRDGALFEKFHTLLKRVK